jgi:hypothetical protein
MKDFDEELRDFLKDPDAWESEKRIETIGDDAHKALFALATELEAKNPVKYAKIIERCRKGYYHDFATKTATPKMDMHRDLLEVGLTDVDQRMQDGEFDS